MGSIVVHRSREIERAARLPQDLADIIAEYENQEDWLVKKATEVLEDFLTYSADVHSYHLDPPRKYSPDYASRRKEYHRFLDMAGNYFTQTLVTWGERYLNWTKDGAPSRELSQFQAKLEEAYRQGIGGTPKGNISRFCPNWSCS